MVDFSFAHYDKNASVSVNAGMNISRASHSTGRSTASDTRAGDSRFGLASSTLVNEFGERFGHVGQLGFPRSWSTPVVRAISHQSFPLVKRSPSVVTGAMELRIIKPSFKYVAGQWLFIQVPDVSGWQWHPVS